MSLVETTVLKPAARRRYSVTLLSILNIKAKVFFLIRQNFSFFGVWDGQGGTTLMVCLTYEYYCFILVSLFLN